MCSCVFLMDIKCCCEVFNFLNFLLCIMFSNRWHVACGFKDSWLCDNLIIEIKLLFVLLTDDIIFLLSFYSIFLENIDTRAVKD